MVLERWKQIEQIYYSVIASPISERAALLDQLCLEDADIRREVESLLHAREQADNFLSSMSLKGQIAELLSEPDLAGKTIGHYEVRSAIGAGAMGEVYLALDTRLDRQVALKILPSHLTENMDRVARFRREAKAASALNHPNIITIFDVGEIGDTSFIAAEFVRGVTLRERLTASKIEPQEAVNIALQCALALEAAHNAGIVHRDIKPENIMLRPDGVVKLLDFGLARIAEAEQVSVDTTQAGTLVGTPRYMSPEQSRGEKLDGRTDIFSLGAVLYEMLTGLAAFPGKTTAEVFAALLSSEPTVPSKCVRTIPDAFDTVTGKALEKDSQLRYRTMEEFAADLKHLQTTNDSSRRFLPKLDFRKLSGAAIFIGVLAFASKWWVSRPSTHPETTPLTVVPVTSFTGLKDFGAFSPDGHRIAFSWNGGRGGNPQRNIYVKEIGPDDPVRLTVAAADEKFPAWSPDGRYIAFCRELFPEPAFGRHAIYIVPATGGEEHKIAEGGIGVSWSRDSKTLAMSSFATESGAILLVSVETGERRQLTNPQPDFDNLPVFSPDGKWIAFTRNFGVSSREIFVIPAEGGAAKQLTFDHEPTYGVAWTADGRDLVFASNRGVGGESLWRVSAKGGTPRRLSPTLEGGFYPSISRQGDRLMYTESFRDSNIYAYSGPGFEHRSVPGRFGESESLIPSSRRDDSPSISPAGDRIAFVSTRTGNEEIWVCDRDGTHSLQLTTFNGPATGTPRWSPDGRQIVFDSLSGGNPNIYVIDAKGGKPRRLTTGSAGNFMPSWSADGKWIYFKSDRSGSDQIWKVSAEGGNAAQLTRNGASEALAGPDGKFVYFTKRPWGRIWLVPVEGGPEKPLPGLERYDRISRSWGVVDRGIYFLSREEARRQTIRFFSFDTGQVTPLLTLDKEPIWNYPDLTLSRDGRLLLFACLDQDVNDLMLIENFQ